FFEGVGSISVAGHLNVQGPGDTANRAKIFLCHPSTQAQEEPCAEKILQNLAHRAYRRPVTADDLAPLFALYRQGAKNGGFESGVKLALGRLPGSPAVDFRQQAAPPHTKPGTVHRRRATALAPPTASSVCR